jgi:F1F0 ATPase subunit 2
MMTINSVDYAWLGSVALEGVSGLLVGVVLGVFYFAGLWWTVRRLNSSEYTALLFTFSMLFRTGVLMLGLYFILGDSWQTLMLGLLGFMLVRLLATRLIQLKEQPGAQAQSPVDIKNKDGYAP